MISIADLLANPRIPGAYYTSQAYVRGDLEMGLLENRRGDRLLALPSTLVQAMYSGLDQETGQATRMVLFNCGRWWGKSFFNRFRDEVTDYYGVAVAQMSMAEFLQCLRDCWATYGWGKFELDHTHHEQGFLVVKTWNSPFAGQAPEGGSLPVCALEAGVLASIFSQLSDRALHCIQTECESLGAEHNTFVIGVRKRILPIDAMVENAVPHESIMVRIAA